MNKLLLQIFFFTTSLLTILSQTPKEELEKLIESYQIPYDFKWYDPQKIYVKLITNKDKIYYVESDSIFSVESYFNGKPHRYLHLIHKSREIPIYIGSANEFFDSGDTLIFLGSRPAGDTTWFDPFSSYEVFYLYFDETNEGLRFSNFDNTSTPRKRTDYINVRYHFEEHHKYSIGQPETSSQTVGGEGWVWELLSPSDQWIKQENFKLGINLYPSTYTDSATFRFFFLSAKFDSNSTRHNISISINNEIAFNRIFEPGKNMLAEFKYPTENLYLGTNFLEIENKGSFKSPGILALPDVVGFQYFEYFGKDIPFAKDGFISCYFNQESSHTSVEISNLRNPLTYLIDTTSKRLSILNSFPSIAFWAKLLDNELRISLNDSIQTSNQKGLHLVTYDSATRSMKYFYYLGDNNKIIAEIRNLSKNSIYIVVFNGNRINNDVVNFFESEGSTSVQRTKDNYQWIFARKIGSDEKFEKINNTARFSLFGQFPANYSNRFTTILNLPQIENIHHFYISDAYALEQAKVKQVIASNLYDTLQQADVIVVCPKIFEDVAAKYIDYRKSTNPEKSFILALTENIYKEFNYGKKSPWAIKRFLAWAYNKWQKPRPSYLVLLGDANFDTRNVLEGSIYKDFVPTFGWPPIDAWYSYLEGNDFVPDIHVGRIPIKTIQEGYDYLEKIKEYDAAQTAPWMKNFLFLSGGENYLEREYFYDRLKGDFADYILGLSPICVRSKVIRKSDEIVGSEADASFIRAAINEGVTFMLFAGHGSAKVFDTDGWKVQTLNNKGKYGFFSSFSCNTANFAEPTLICRNEEYTLFPDKGFVATIGSVEVSIRLYSLILASHLLTTIADSNVKTDYLVALLDIAKEKMIKSYVDYYTILTTYNYVFLGDPLLRMKIPRKPDFYFINNYVDIVNESGKSDFTQSDSIFIVKGVIGNAGFSTSGNYSLWLIHTYSGKSDTLKKYISELCFPVDFHFQIPIQKRVGTHNFKIWINPEKKIEEFNYNNNILSYNIEVYASSLLPVEPLSHWNVPATNPLFRFVDPNFVPERDSVSFKIYQKRVQENYLLYSSHKDEIELHPVKIDWRPKISLSVGSFWLSAQKTSKDTTILAQQLLIPFHTMRSSTDTTVLLSFQSNDDFSYSKFKTTNLLYDTIENAFKFDTIKIPYKIMSCVGKRIDDRGKEITVNNKVYVTMAPDLDIVGFHVVLISHKDFSLIKYKIFETWGTDPPEKDSSSIHLVRFLRDSVPEKDYIFLVLNNSALRVPIAHQLYNPKSPGSLDTLRQAFREWGCKFADSLGSDLNRFGNSFFMVGRVFQGKKILIDEGFDFDGDTVESSSFIYQIPRTAKIKSPILGPAKNWKTLKFSVNHKDTTIKTQTSIYGLTAPFEYQKEIISENLDGSIFDITSSKYKSYPYIIFETEISNPEESQDFSYGNVSCEYVPSPEIAILLEKPQAKQIDTLRGEELSFSTKIFNLSTKVSIDTASLLLIQRTVSQENTYDKFHKLNLLPNDSACFKGIIISDKLDKQTTFNFVAKQNLAELYSFNNLDYLNVSLREDTTKPSIFLYLDGIKIRGGEYVSKKPSIFIEIYDNSRLPFDTSSTTLLINITKNELGKNSRFISYGRNVPLKCSYELESDELEYGLNHFTVYTIDPSGNRDTLDVPVYVARKAKIQSYSVVPNPITEEASFFINYISPQRGATAYVEIFDFIGNKIRTISKPISMNEDYIFWDGLDNDGRSIPQGVYLFRINVVGEIYSEPIFGKILKVK